MAQDKQGKKKAPSRTVQLPVRFDLAQSPGDSESTAAAVYAFSSGGRLLASAPVESGKQVELKIAVGQEADRVRVLAGPQMAEEQVSVEHLLRIGAVEKFVRVETGLRLEPLTFRVFPDEWLCWLRSLCSVPGQLLQRRDVDGTEVDFPVCNATVEVYEVSSIPWIIDRLPDPILVDLRERLLHGGLRRPIPEIDFPPRPPLPTPGPRPLPISRSDKSHSVQAVAADHTLSPELQTRLRFAGGQELRRTLATLPELVRPLLCWFYPRFVTIRKVAEARTDSCGRFRALYFRGCHADDRPDLYFRAKRRLFPFYDVTLYSPTPIACHTHWNYECGSQVTLYTSHPLAQTCTPCSPVNASGHWVLVTAIGNLPLSRIRGTSVELNPSTTSDNRGFCYTMNDDPDAFGGRPFGGLLRLRLDFSNSLRSELNVRYYRVSWREKGAGDNELLHLDQEAHRHYIFQSGDDMVIEGYLLGPKEVNNTPELFEIPPALPPKGNWTVADAVEDTTNARFPTHTLVPPEDHGEYELVIELFDVDGNRVDINDVGGEVIRYYVPETWDLSTAGTIETHSAHGAPLNLVQSVDGRDAFVMPLHIDNNSCTAELDSPAIAGVSANDCGVLTYGNSSASVNMPFTARHPNGFASYSFTLKRGVTTLSALDDNGQAADPGLFTASATVDELLQGGCSIGGFSAHLRVHAWAHNGWSRLSGYDETDHAGFAIAPDDIG